MLPRTMSTPPKTAPLETAPLGSIRHSREDLENLRPPPGPSRSPEHQTAIEAHNQKVVEYLENEEEIYPQDPCCQYLVFISRVLKSKDEKNYLPKTFNVFAEDSYYDIWEDFGEDSVPRVSYREFEESLRTLQSPGVPAGPIRLEYENSDYVIYIENVICYRDVPEGRHVSEILAAFMVAAVRAGIVDGPRGILRGPKLTSLFMDPDTIFMQTKFEPVFNWRIPQLIESLVGYLAVTAACDITDNYKVKKRVPK